MPSSSVRTTLLLALTVVVMAVAGEWFLAAVYGETEVACRQTSLPTSLVEVPEASGIASSGRRPNLLWAINDSGEPRLFAIDGNGQTQGRVAVSQAQLTDWEDISIRRCGDGSCVYVADIGDNNGDRSSVRLYRMPEPEVPEKSRQADGMDVRYPDGPHDAEAMFVLPDEQIFIITKQTPSVVYRAPSFKAGASITLERVMSLPVGKVTDAETSPDGRWIAIRTNEEAIFYRTDRLMGGDVEHATTVSLEEFAEPQGEGIAFGSAGAVYLAGEGGGKGAPGTLLGLECALPNEQP